MKGERYLVPAPGPPAAPPAASLGSGAAWRRPPPPSRGLSLLPSLAAAEPSQDSGSSDKLSRPGSRCPAQPRRTHGPL